MISVLSARQPWRCPCRALAPSDTQFWVWLFPPPHIMILVSEKSAESSSSCPTTCLMCLGRITKISVTSSESEFSTYCTVALQALSLTSIISAARYSRTADMKCQNRPSQLGEDLRQCVGLRRLVSFVREGRPHLRRTKNRGLPRQTHPQTLLVNCARLRLHCQALRQARLHH